MSHRKVFPVLIIVFILVSLVSSANEDDSLTDSYNKWLRANKASILKQYVGLLSLPNVARNLDDCQRNAEHIAAMLNQRGLTTQLFTLPGAPPLVYAEISSESAATTLLIYAHYDGQPVEVEKWHSKPWQPVFRDRDLAAGGKEIPLEEASQTSEARIFARAASDDKAPIMAILAALDFLKENNIQLSVNLKFIIDGEEEAGSPHLPEFLKQHLSELQSDLLLLSDGPVDQSRKMQLYFGARGSMGFEATLYGPSRALHSGHYGNWAANPAARLAELISTMRRGDGEILIEGYYDSVTPLNEPEKAALEAMQNNDAMLLDELQLAKPEKAGLPLVRSIMRPAINIRGFQSGGAKGYSKNAIPTEAWASIGLRLVPGQQPEELQKLIEKHIVGQGYYIVHEEPDAQIRRAHDKVIYLDWKGGYRGARTSMTIPLSKKMIGLAAKATDGDIVIMPNLGGSVPMYLFEDLLQVPIIGLPIVNHDNNQHAPDENLRLQNLWDGIKIFAWVFAEFGM